MGKKAKENKLEINLDLFNKSTERTSFLSNENIITESEPRTVSETLSTIDFIEGFDEKVFLKTILEKFYNVEKLIDKINELISKKFSQTNIETIGIDESKVIEEPDSTEIISEERNMEKLIETNRFLIMRNDELTKKIEVFTENYEELTNENNENLKMFKKQIESLEKQVERLIKSKERWLEVPDYLIQEKLKEYLENELIED